MCLKCYYRDVELHGYCVREYNIIGHSLTEGIIVTVNDMTLCIQNYV